MLLDAHQSEVDDEVWEGAVNRFNSVMHDNAARRVDLMGEVDRQRYFERFNTATPAKEDILSHLMQWGDFYKLVMRGELDTKQSALFNRLSKGKDPLPFPPPRYFRQPWYDLFDNPGVDWECTVSFKGPSTRLRDQGKKVWVLLINNCPWECEVLSADANTLLELDTQWKSADAAGRQAMAGQVQDAFDGEIWFDVRFGQWEEPCRLWLAPRSPNEPSQSVVTDLPVDAAESLLSVPNVVSGSPVHWLLRNS